jgi:hypothetical protein
MALQMVDAMAPFAGAGIINMQELAGYVLSQGFNIKNPEKFLSMPAPAPMGPEGGAPPEGGMPPQGMPPQGMVPPEQMPPEGGLPPEIMALLQQGQPGVQ